MQKPCENLLGRKMVRVRGVQRAEAGGACGVRPGLGDHGGGSVRTPVTGGDAARSAFLAHMLNSHDGVP